MNHGSAVLVRFGAALAVLWLAGLGVMKLGRVEQALDRPFEPGDESSRTYGEASLLTRARDSDLARAPTISSVLPSTLLAGRASTVKISGSRLSGAFVTGSRGMRVTSVQIEVDTLVLEVFVDAAAMPGPASLTLMTGGGAITVPITIAASRVPVTTAGGRVIKLNRLDAPGEHRMLPVER